jgi:hypothetical protein
MESKPAGIGVVPRDLCRLAAGIGTTETGRFEIPSAGGRPWPCRIAAGGRVPFNGAGSDDREVNWFQWTWVLAGERCGHTCVTVRNQGAAALF